MTNHPIEREELMAYLDGELPVDRAGVAAGHLDDCRECQGLAADLQGVSRRLMEWQVEPLVPVGEDLAVALEQLDRKPKVGRLAHWAWGMMAATCGVVLVLSLAMPRMNSSRYAAQTYAELARSRASAKPVPAPNASSLMIARNAEIILTTNEFDKARAGLEEILKRHSGYLGQLNVNAPTGAARILDATLRIPADQRDAAIAEIKKLGRVEAESQTGEEVTAQYVDLEARLSNARNTEQRLTELLRERTGKLADVLAVEESISRVRGEIEQMEAEKKTLTTRVQFLTLVVRLTEDDHAQLHMAPDSILGRCRNAAIAGYKFMLEGLVSVVLFLLSYGPSLLICAAILFFPARFAYRKLRRS